MLLQKPVFIGGNIFFDNAPGVIKVTDIFEKYLPLLLQWKKTSDEMIVKYLFAYFRAIRPGRDWYADSDENISLIVDALMEAIKRK